MSQAVSLTKSATPQGQSLWKLARRRLLRNKAAMISFAILFLLTVLALITPYLPVCH